MWNPCPSENESLAGIEAKRTMIDLWLNPRTLSSINCRVRIKVKLECLM